MKCFKLSLLAYFLVAIFVYVVADAQESNQVRNRRAGSYEKAHHSVTDSFQQLVGEFADSTVRVLVAGKQVGLGTVVGEDGLILTKASSLADQFECELRGGERLAGELIGADEQFDLALVRIDAQAMKPIKFSENTRPNLPVG